MAGSDAGVKSEHGKQGRAARLRQYQEQLLERMQAAQTSSGARAHQLGVEIGGVRYLLDLLEAGEIVPLPPLAAVPLTRPWYLGLANVRGNLVGVVDLARFLAQDAAPDPAPAAAPSPGAQRLITFGPALGFPCALLVTRVFGLRQAADMTPQDGRLLDADGNAWTPLALSALAREERFLQVGL
ncbi:chemotaxis protein CheW [Massilia sp. 9096]|uniref:chemotaxis protein CheW n=1 Tax=Massilia sp. 9096 TaxID=1500894 RepID=UPI00068E5700|nr:chemotaxis protein CheW [Massilia sp. 9096]